MKAEDLLIQIQKASQPEDLLSRSNYRKQYLSYLKLLHPDVCSLVGANEAVEKLNAFREYMEQFSQFEDDAGRMLQTDEKTLVFRGDRALLVKSLENYRRLKQLNDESARHFHKYLPTSVALEADQLRVTHSHRLVPLTHLHLPQEHVSWILSRMFELVSWFHQVGYCHAGIHPESIAVVPETHGIVCLSFYHMQPLDTRLSTISGKYMDWYPQLVFDRKQALPYIDVSLAQRTALYLLGDKSGNGIKLKNTCNEQLIDFLITPHYQAYSTYEEYRKLLKSIFGKPKFHELVI